MIILIMHACMHASIDHMRCTCTAAARCGHGGVPMADKDVYVYVRARDVIPSVYTCTNALLKFKLGDVGALECACEGSQSGRYRVGFSRGLKLQGLRVPMHVHVAVV